MIYSNEKISSEDIYITCEYHIDDYRDFINNHSVYINNYHIDDLRFSLSDLMDDLKEDFN